MVRKPGTVRRGVAAVEFAVVMPGVLLLLMGILEVGRLVEMQQVLSNAVREGARQAATGQLTNSQVQTVVTQYIAAAGFSTSNMTITVQDLTTPGTDVSQANYLDQVQVSIIYPYSNVAWSTLSWVLPANYQLASQATWMSMVDQQFPSFPTPPVG